MERAPRIFQYMVPLLEAPPLARALHRHAEAGDAIPAALYTAVAEVMAWVFQMDAYAKDMVDAAPPVAPRDIAVPAGLDPGVPA